MKIKKSVELDLLFGKVKAQQRTKLQYRRSVLFKKKLLLSGTKSPKKQECEWCVNSTPVEL